jgi:predicted permease
MLSLLHRLETIPGVRSATFSENGLFSGVESRSRIQIDGFSPASDEDLSAHFDQVGPGYFTNVGIPLVLGRDFDERDGPGAPRVTIVNATMARFYFGDENPIGRRVRLGGPDEPSLEIVGVAHDAQDHDLRSERVRRFYVSYLQPIDGIVAVNFELRAAGSVAPLFAAVRTAIERFDPRLPILGVRSAEALVDDSLMAERLIATLSTVFGALAAVLAAIGLYGVMSYSVARRTGELGIRLALGARSVDVAWMIQREVLGLVAIGMIAGAVVALALARFVETLMFGLAPHDPLSLGMAAALLVIVAVIAGYLPARRASRVDPVVALRAE